MRRITSIHNLENPYCYLLARMNATSFFPDAHRGPGVCAMRGGCGRKSPFDPELPCVDDGAADEVGPPLVPTHLSTFPIRRNVSGG